MKKLLFIVCVLAGFSYVKAQAPQGFSYQAAVRNASGTPLVNIPVKVRFSILDSSANGPVVYKETHTTTTNAGGLFNVNVGLGTAITGTLAGVNWGSNAKFLQVEIDTTATGNNYTNLGVQQLMSVPYALYAGNYTLTNSFHGSTLLTSSTIYTVPEGIREIQITIRGSKGGNAGNIYNWNGNILSSGGQGGDAGILTFNLFVNTNDSLNFIIGNDGADGSSIGSSSCTYCNAGNGINGQSSFVYLNGLLIAELTGGTGGNSGLTSWNANVVNGTNGSSGTLNLNSALNSGILNYNMTPNNYFNLQLRQVLLRY